MSGKGLVIVYTAGGKGKTSAALGLVLRAVGYNHKVCMIQFVKGSRHYGELDSAKRLEPEFELITAGKGFVGIIDDKSPREDHVKAANDALSISKEKILSGKYDVVILGHTHVHGIIANGYLNTGTCQEGKSDFVLI